MDNSLSKQATDWREGRRFRAFELKQQGWSQQQIADALGVSKGVRGLGVCVKISNILLAASHSWHRTGHSMRKK
jgi:hypothetical protein